MSCPRTQCNAPVRARSRVQHTNHQDTVPPTKWLIIIIVSEVQQQEPWEISSVLLFILLLGALIIFFFLLFAGLDSEGIYRISGFADDVEALKSSFDKGNLPTYVH